MAHAKHNTPSPQWWKHLREWKRLYWKRVRANERAEMRGLIERVQRHG